MDEVQHKFPKQKKMKLPTIGGEAITLEILDNCHMRLSVYEGEGMAENKSLPLASVDLDENMCRVMAAYSVARLRHFVHFGSLTSQILRGPGCPIDESNPRPSVVRFGGNEGVHVRELAGSATVSPDTPGLEPADPKEAQNDGDPIKEAAQHPAWRDTDPSEAMKRIEGGE